MQTTLDPQAFARSADAAARMLRALASAPRLMILCQLTGGEHSVGALQPLTGLSQSALSQHLAVLREEGLVGTRRKHQHILYHLADPDAARLLETLAAIYCPPPAQETENVACNHHA
jgi:ArsR family transcriptional regulator